MNVIVEHKWRNRFSAWCAAIYLALALGFAGVHSHYDDELAADLSHECGACLVVSDLDNADVPAGISIPENSRGSVVLLEPSWALTSLETVKAKARAPPIYT